MKTTSTLVVALGLLLGTSAKAQVNVPVNDISLEFPGAPTVTLHVQNASSSINVTETVIPTPFLISLASLNSINSWLCMDPLQRIYYDGSGYPNSVTVDYPSSNPSDFDKWDPSAPGLTTARVQDLADLFKQFSTIPDTALNSAALQLAVWEVANEFSSNSYDLSSGAFSASGNATEISLAQSMLNSLSTPAVHNKGNAGALSFLIDGTLDDGSLKGAPILVQDLVGYNPATINLLIPVPEPSTYGLGAILGLGLITAIRRRRARA